ncbi:SAP domain-containing protein [Candidatus Poseidoniales archaeon]|nr:SAP domain-containing protein [Candidatus Poseidoniales archaeon]
MNYESLTIIQLKTMCRERGLRVSGTKNEVIIRLMEHDEGSVPRNQQSLQPQYQQQYMQAPQQIIHITKTNGTEAFAQTIGTFIVIYGVFRIGMAMFFSAFDEEVFLFESMLAWAIGFFYIIGGVFTILGYRNGLFLTLGVLLVSGSLSIMYHDEWSPLSVGLDGTLPIEWSIMCSFSCSIFVALPLAAGFNDLKPGWPFDGPSGHVLNRNTSQSVAQHRASQRPSPSQSDDKTLLECPYCSARFNVQKGTSGTATCPSCKKKVSV